LPVFVGGDVLDGSYPSRSEEESWYGFDLHLGPGMVSIFFFVAIWTSSFEKVLFSSVGHFFIGSLILGEFSFLGSLYVLITYQSFN
jgi:hypothetical protein